MAFFDDFSKKISQAGQGVAQSTKNFATQTKLNGVISDEEKKINNLYYQIGKLFFETNSFGADPLFAPYIDAINESMNIIAQCNEQLKEIKGVATCPTCGADVPFSSAFCNSCGTKMPVHQQPVPPNTTQCLVCGAYVPNGYKFCTSCGNVMPVLEDAPPAATPMPEPMPVAAPVMAPAAAPAAAEKSCPSCGKSLPAEAMFCTGCGSSV